MGMLLVQDTIVKLGGINLPGQIKSIEIQETASIDEIEDDKGTTKSNQPTGYDSAKVVIDILLEDSADLTSFQQIQEVERLFKTEGQKVSNLIEIVCDDCSSRGISMVYFKNFVTKRVISESTQVASLELWTPMIAEIKTKKASSGSGTGSGSRSGTGSRSGMSAADKKLADQTFGRLKNSYDKAKDAVTNTVKKFTDSPAVQDLRNSSAGKLAAKLLVGKK